MGLDVYLSWPEATPKYPEYEGSDITVDIDSVAHPEHYWKRTYLRSSYNGGGFNRVVGNVCEGRDLYWVFEKMMQGADDRYGGTYHPNDEQLQDARLRALSLRDDFTSREALGVDFESAIPIRPQDGIPTTDEEAVAKYREEAARERPADMGAYSNSAGVFYLDEPLKVKAIITGKGFMGMGHYLVYEMEKTYYLEACDILIEFIDEAISHPERTVVWSG